MARGPRTQTRKRQPYGIGEWFGRDYLLTTRETRERLVIEALKRYSDERCRFRESFPAMAPRNRQGKPNLNCTKIGGVCCLRQHKRQENGREQYGPLVTTCPVRFCEDGTVFAHIAQCVLSASRWRFAKEIDFLNPDVAPPLFLAPHEAETVVEEAQPGQQPADDEDARSVGRIDMVLAAADENGEPTGDWCAVELQAVYFQGDGMKAEWVAIRQQAEARLGNNEAPPEPVKNRRPDFRSSGPKRLLPQLQIKVPSLRRWGKKMAVVVDAPFFTTFGPMKRADHVSNADIVWCVVGYERHPEDGLFGLRVLGTYMTTLEEAVIGLTAGKPMSKPDFEAILWAKLGSETY